MKTDFWIKMKKSNIQMCVTESKIFKNIETHLQLILDDQTREVSPIVCNKYERKSFLNHLDEEAQLKDNDGEFFLLIC
jgi:hypothetical protein